MTKDIGKRILKLSRNGGQRFHSNPRGMNGSPTGLEKLPNDARQQLYRELCPLVGSSHAHQMRDWRPTKIILFLQNGGC